MNHGAKDSRRRGFWTLVYVSFILRSELGTLINHNGRLEIIRTRCHLFDWYRDAASNEQSLRTSSQILNIELVTG